MRKIIGVTGPSQFTDNVLQAVEEFFDCTHIHLSHDTAGDLYYFAEQCNAIILGGGRDIHPHVYNRQIQSGSNYRKFDIMRDRREIRLINYALKNNIPILGICRGHQILGVYHKVELIPDLLGSPIVHNPYREGIEVSKIDPLHWIKLTSFGEKTFPSERIASLKQTPDDADAELYPANPTIFWVNSYHHQALRCPETSIPVNDKNNKTGKPKFKNIIDFEKYEKIDILGYAFGPDNDKIIELMKSPEDKWISCQWHPELDYDTNIYSQIIFQHFKEMIEKNERRPARATKTK